MTKPRENPWFSSATKVLIDKRDTAFQKWKRYKTNQHEAHFFTRFNRATTSQQKCADIKRQGIGMMNLTKNV